MQMEEEPYFKTNDKGQIIKEDEYRDWRDQLRFCIEDEFTINYSHGKATVILEYRFDGLVKSKK